MKYDVDPSQNYTTDGSTFGYVSVGDGGLFFTWRYDDDAAEEEQIDQVLSTLEEDAVDPPTGYWSHESVETSIREHISAQGMHPNTAGD